MGKNTAEVSSRKCVYFQPPPPYPSVPIRIPQPKVDPAAVLFRSAFSRRPLPITAYLPSIAQSAAEGPAYSPAWAFSGLGKNSSEVSSLDLGERQTRSRFFLSPWTPLFFHAESPDWLDNSRSGVQKRQVAG